MVKIVNNTPFESFEDYKTQALDGGYPSYINPDYKPFYSIIINGQNRANQITFEQLFDPDFEALFPGVITELEVSYNAGFEVYTLTGYSLTLEDDGESIILSGSIDPGLDIYEFYPPEEEFKSKVVSSIQPEDMIFEKTFKGGGKHPIQGYFDTTSFYEVVDSPFNKNVYHWWGFNGPYLSRRYFYNLKIGSGSFLAFSRGLIFTSEQHNKPYDIYYSFDYSGSENPVYFGVELIPSEKPEYRTEMVDGINSGEIFFTPASPLKNIEISGDYGGLDDGFGEFYSNLLIPFGATATFYDERIRNEKPLRIETSSGITTSFDEFGNLSITNNNEFESGFLKLYKDESSPDPGGSDSDEEWWAMMQSSGSLK